MVFVAFKSIDSKQKLAIVQNIKSKKYKIQCVGMRQVKHYVHDEINAFNSF